MAKTRYKSRTLSFVLWFFLGSVGAHRFYLRRVGTGFAVLGYTVVQNMTEWGAAEFYPNVSFFYNGSFYLLTSLPLYIFLVMDAFKIPNWVRELNA